MNIEKIISQMTLEEKCAMLSGQDFWHTTAVDRLGIEPVMVSDGTNGLRKQDVDSGEGGKNTSIKAVCMPASCAAAASFDRELLYREGAAVGDACRHEKVGVLLGPAMNIKRSPLCGRNFEYYSEDPYLAGELASSVIRGVQSRGVAACAKHFAANNQEYRRFTVDSVMNERTLREIYLPAFEASVKKGGVMSMMCAYNMLNGEHCAKNRKLLNDILRDEWKFEGYVMSDWGAVDDRTEDVRAGLDLQMPGPCDEDDRKVLEAVRSGELDEAYVDLCIRRLLGVNNSLIMDKDGECTPWDKEADHALAGEIAQQCMVLLKNQDDILPLKQDERIAVIGEFAAKPRYQGGGSAHVNAFRVTSLMDALQGNENIEYAAGYSVRENDDPEELLVRAVETAKRADKVVIVAGLPDSYECEGYDRQHLNMPEDQNKLIREVSAVNPNTVVVLYNGSPVLMPWLDSVKGVLEAYLGGQNVGEATYRVLYGKVSPSGRLPETFPLRIEDTSCYMDYGLPGDTAPYSEGVFVGYRWYDKRCMDVLFPFGYGLSYTQFEYSDLSVSAERITDKDILQVRVNVTNVGKMAGKEVVQLYVADRQSRETRPIRELKGFEKVDLQPGETTSVAFELDMRAFAYWDERINGWYVESGDFGIEVCRNSREVCLSTDVYVESTTEIGGPVSMESVYEDLRAYTRLTPKMKALLDLMEDSFLNDGSDETANEAITPEMKRKQLAYTPLRGLVTLACGTAGYNEIMEAINEMNMLYMRSH